MLVDYNEKKCNGKETIQKIYSFKTFVTANNKMKCCKTWWIEVIWPFSVYDANAFVVSIFLLHNVPRTCHIFA